MRNWKSLGLALGLLMVITACGGGAGTGGTTTTEATDGDTTTTEAMGDTTTITTTGAAGEALLIWADENRATVLEEVAPAFEEQTGVPVEIQIVDFGAIRDEVKTAAPQGEGPDLFVGPHDWTGELVTAGVVDPIDLGSKASDFVPVSLDAFNFEGQLYAVPYATEAVAMYYNRALAPEAPATFEDAQAACQGMEGVENCYGVPGGGDAADAYHNYPFISAYGGYIFAFTEGEGFDASDVGLDNEGSIQGVTFLDAMTQAGVIGSVNYDTAKNLFLEGSQPFWMTGPWERGTLEDSDLDWDVALIPTMEGNTPQPFVGAQGFFLNSFSENKVVAQSFLLDFVATSQTMRAFYDADPRIPAFSPTLDEVSSDEVTATFSDSVASGIPMPNIPQMATVWGPLGDAFLQIRNQEQEPEPAMQAAAEQVREAVAQ